jgi:putative nucleotidyltransferase with HDIG domain
MIDFHRFRRRFLSFLNRLAEPTRSSHSASNSSNVPAASADTSPKSSLFRGKTNDVPDLQEMMAAIQKASGKSLLELIGTLRALASASDRVDPYTRGHSERVTRFSVEIAKIMELPDEEIEQIRIGALIHDIGKIAIDGKVLNKSTPLTDSEYALMKTHTTMGYELLKDISSLKEILPCITFHHEQLDGKGYPHGLKGSEIPMIARIVTVADCYDAIITARPYQDPASTEQALGILRSGAGSKYDVRVVNALVQGVRTGRIQARSEDKVKIAD